MTTIKVEKNIHPLVSIIVVTYNSSRFVLETLESISKQTYWNIELIITDDCSSDNTVAICSDWVDKNSDRFARAKIITIGKNTGIPSNCNRGIKTSHGQWVKLIGGDDQLLETCIKDNIEFVRDNPNAKFIVSDLLEINDRGDIIENYEQKKEKDNRLKFFFNAQTAQEQLKNYVRWPVFLFAPTFFINKQLLKDIDYFDEEYRIFEDTTLIFRVNSSGVIIHFMDRPTVKYRIHDKAISRNVFNNDERNKEVISIFRKYRKEDLSKFNLIDLSIYYELWYKHYWKGFRGITGYKVLRKLSLFHWYSKYIIYKLERTQRGGRMKLQKN